MSRLVFTSPSDEAAVHGAEYHWLRRLVAGPGQSSWNVHGYERAKEIFAFIRPGPDYDYLFPCFEKAEAEERRNKQLWDAWYAQTPGTRGHMPYGVRHEASSAFLSAFKTALRVHTMRIEAGGADLRTGDLELNTALVAGSDPVRLAAKLAHWADRFPYVEGPDRAWIADLIDKGLATGLYRASLEGHDIGWPGVTALLRSRDDEPVVCWYTVEDSFPSRSIADWEPPVPFSPHWLPKDCATEEGFRADYSDADEAYRRALYDEEMDESWYDLPETERWERSMAGLRRQRPWARLSAETLAYYTFGPGVSVYDLFAPDQDDRIARALEED